MDEELSLHAEGDKSRVSHGIQTTSLLFQATQKKHRMMGFESAEIEAKLDGFAEIGGLFSENRKINDHHQPETWPVFGRNP